MYGPIPHTFSLRPAYIVLLIFGLRWLYYDIFCYWSEANETDELYSMNPLNTIFVDIVDDILSSLIFVYFQFEFQSSRKENVGAFGHEIITIHFLYSKLVQ